MKHLDMTLKCIRFQRSAKTLIKKNWEFVSLRRQHFGYSEYSTCVVASNISQGVFLRHIAIPSEVARPGACVPVHLVNELVKLEADCHNSF